MKKNGKTIYLIRSYNKYTGVDIYAHIEDKKTVHLYTENGSYVQQISYLKYKEMYELRYEMHDDL